MDAKELMACPFCAGKAEMKHLGEHFGASCADWKCQGMQGALMHRSEAAAADAWNCRAALPSDAAQAPTNGIPATLRHDEGAIARCSYCGRYSIDPQTLSDRQPKCECGEKHGWSGSFIKPGPDAKWSGAAPVAPAAAAPSEELSERATLAAANWANSDTPVATALAYRDGFVAGTRSRDTASPAPLAAAGPTDGAMHDLLIAITEYAHDSVPIQIYEQACALLAAAPKAARPTDDQLWDQTLRERDNYCEWSDKLADAIALHLGIDIGEHSSANNPWSEALDAIMSAPKAAEQAPVADAARGEPASAANRVNLDGWQLLEALNYLAPDRDTDPDQLDGDVTIQFGNGHSGEALYCWNGDYPDDGAFVLDGSTVDRDTLTQQPARASDAGKAAWQPIETAPKTGRTVLLGYMNAAGKWRTVRGQWMSETYIAENWEEPDDVEPGWFETSVEADDVPNCWRVEPTHWMSLPPAPGAAPAQQAVTLTDAARDVLAERRRQVEQEGWTPEHDDGHDAGEMASAAAAYAAHSCGWNDNAVRDLWPPQWHLRWLKTSTSRRDLEKAGALILAEIERLDRTALQSHAEGSQRAD